jgi:hypothetical protein
MRSRVLRGRDIETMRPLRTVDVATLATLAKSWQGDERPCRVLDAPLVKGGILQPNLRWLLRYSAAIQISGHRRLRWTHWILHET